MCLLIHKPAGVDIAEDWLRDFFVSNDDGYGIMYAKDGVLKIHKALGTASMFVAAFKERVEHECLIHLRMRTHGEIDLDNCHPYEVLSREEGGKLGGVWMMHNGVLPHGNDADKKYSDTWHYARDWLAPILREHPGMLLNPTFQGLVGNDISDSNRLAFMTSSGEVVVINRSSGVEWGGCWMSNTYAWSAGKAGVKDVSPYTGWTSSRGSYRGAWWDDDEFAPAYREEDAYFPGSTFDAPKNKWTVGVKEEEVAEREYDVESDFFAVLKKYNFNQSYEGLNLDIVCAAFEAQPEAMEDLVVSIEEGGLTASIDDDYVMDIVYRCAGSSLEDETEDETEDDGLTLSKERKAA